MAFYFVHCRGDDSFCGMLEGEVGGGWSFRLNVFVLIVVANITTTTATATTTITITATATATSATTTTTTTTATTATTATISFFPFIRLNESLRWYEYEQFQSKPGAVAAFRRGY